MKSEVKKMKKTIPKERRAKPEKKRDHHKISHLIPPLACALSLALNISLAVTAPPGFGF